MDTEKSVKKPKRQPARKPRADSSEQPPQRRRRKASTKSTVQPVTETAIHAKTKPITEHKKELTRQSVEKAARKSTEQPTRQPSQQPARAPERQTFPIVVSQPMTIHQLNNTPSIRPLKIEEATNYITTRVPPARSIQPIRHYKRRTVEPGRITNPALHLPHNFCFVPSQNTRDLPEPTTNPFHDSSSGDVVPSQRTRLPGPTPTPLLHQRHLKSLSAQEVDKINCQRIYVMVYHSLERGNGWIWWEKDWVDVRKIEEELFERDVVDNKQDAGTDANGDTAMREVLGEEEEEVPEHEKRRSDMYKKVASRMAKGLVLGAGTGKNRFGY